MHTSENQGGNDEPRSHYYGLRMYWLVIELIYIDELVTNGLLPIESERASLQGNTEKAPQGFEKQTGKISV